MATILDTIADYARGRVKENEKRISLPEIKELATSVDTKRTPFAFESALKKEAMSFICEVKKASPSKGVIDPEFRYLEIAKAYEAVGADCVSCLTEPKWFLGSDRIFTDIREQIATPMIRKDFTVSDYQIYEAKLMGADAVLLICSLLDAKTLEEYLSIAKSLGMSALVETHDEREIQMAVAAGAGIIGVNNRNLKDFSVDFENAKRLRRLIPDSCIYVAESGVKGVDDIKVLSEIGADAVLMGEVLMRAENKAMLLRNMREAAL